MYGTKPMEVAASLGSLSLDDLKKWNALLLQKGNQPSLNRLVQIEIGRRHEPLNVFSAVNSFSNRQLKDSRVARQFPIHVVQSVLSLRKGPVVVPKSHKKQKKHGKVMKPASTEAELLTIPDGEAGMAMEIDAAVESELLESNDLDEIIRSRKEAAEKKKEAEKEEAK